MYEGRGVCGTVNLKQTIMKQLLLLVSLILLGTFLTGTYLSHSKNMIDKLSSLSLADISFNSLASNDNETSTIDHDVNSDHQILHYRSSEYYTLQTDERRLYFSASYPTPFDSVPNWEVVCEQQGSSYGEGISAGDVNGDGFEDIAVGAPEYEPTGAVFIYFGSASGPSIIPNEVIFGEGYIYFGNRVDCKGDINNDGYNDLVTGDYFQKKLYAYYGSFSGLPTTPSAVVNAPPGAEVGFAYEVAISDVNNDGYSDVIAGTAREQIVASRTVGAYVYVGSSAGLITSGPAWVASLDSTIEGTGFGWDVANAGDVNGDGFEDIVVGCLSNYAAVYYGETNRGFFQSPNKFYVANPNLAFSSVSGNGDFNSDGYDDIIIGGNSSVVAYSGSALGLSDFPIWSMTYPNACFAYMLSAGADFNDDGYGDISIMDCDSVHVYFGQAEGLSTQPTIVHNSCYSLSYGDVNGDSICDLLIGREPRAYAYFGSHVTSHLNAFINSVSPGMHSVSVNRSSDINVVFTQNMDASTLTPANIKVNAKYSGVLPILINFSPENRSMRIDPQIEFKAGEKVYVTLTSGVQTAGDNPITPFTYSFIAAATGGSESFLISDSIDITGNVKAGDIDGDGDIDIAAGNGVNGIGIFKNNGIGHFEIASEVVGATSTFELEDFDADGDLDIASSNENNLIKLFLNNGNGSFIHSTSSTAFLGKASDFDGDGDPDMANVYSGFDIQIVRNENTVFNNADTVHALHNCQQQCYPMSDIEIDDFDNDGDMDILELHFTACEEPFVFFGCRKVDLFKNDGFGRFSKVTIYDASVGPDEGGILDENFITSINMDGDSDLDLLIYGVKMANDGSGIFSNSPFSIQFHYVKKSVLDINGDGSLDYTQDGGGQYANLGFRINDGHGSFHDGQTINNFGDLKCFGDFDGDGDIDLYSQWNGKGYIHSNEDCLISGPSYVPILSEPVAFFVANAFGYWTLSNYDLTQAAIVSGINDDSVLVDPGSVGGHFVLYYQDINKIFCSKHVYVESPLPAELSLFNSALSGNDLILSWSTSTELNNSGFEIQRVVQSGKLKVESELWSMIGFVSGGGTTIEPREYSFTDRNLETGKYKYRLKQLDFNGNFEYFELAEVVSIGIPDKYYLSQNYPNPFNPVTTINYDLPNDGIVTIKVYDILGRELKTLMNEMKTAGYHKIQFNAADLASGAYFYRLVVSPSNQMKVGDFVAVKKLVLVK